MRDKFNSCTAPGTPAQNPLAGFLDERQLLACLPVCRRTLHAWRAKGLIPFVRLPGSRRVLFHWASVEAALLRIQRGDGGAL